MLDRMNAQPGDPRPSGGDDASTGVGSPEEPGSSPSASKDTFKLEPTDGLLLPISATCGTATAKQDGVEVTELIFSSNAPRHCYPDGLANFDHILRDYPKRDWQVSPLTTLP